MAHQQRVDMRVDERNPLLGAGAGDRVPRRQWRAGKGVVDVKADRARFAQRQVAVAHRRDLAERVDRADLRGVRQRWHEGVGHVLFDAGDAGDPDIIALRRADDLKLRHVCSLPLRLAGLG